MGRVHPLQPDPAPFHRRIALAGVGFALAVTLIFAILAITTVASLESIDAARIQSDRTHLVVDDVLAASNEERAAIRALIAAPSSTEARNQYLAARNLRTDTAARYASVKNTATVKARIARSEERFADWQTFADERAQAYLNDPNRRPTDEAIALGTSLYERYRIAVQDINDALDRNVERYRSALARRLITALLLGAALTAASVAIVVLWTRANNRTMRTLASSRAAIADAHAQVSQISDRLQAAMLGHAFSTNPRVAAVARYVPAEATLSVGGDWYDIIDLDSGEVACIIGDVVGHGLDAAAAMGQMRALLAGLVLDLRDPGSALEALDAFATRLPDAQNATAIIAIVDPTGERLRWARAGHPPPLVLSVDGAPEYLGEAVDPPIGVPRPAARRTFTTAFPSGSTLVLYSDGLVERRDESIDTGLARLAECAELGVDLPAAALCDHLLERCVAESGFGDDVALLVCRTQERHTRRFSHHLPADARGLRALRDDLRTWLADQRVDPAVTDDVVLALNEVATNSIEHAYADTAPGVVSVTGARTDDDLRFRVTDHGTWRNEPPDDSGGHGARVAEACMDEVTVNRRATGTTVSLRRSLQPVSD